MNSTSCNGSKRYAFDNAPRCCAKTKRNNGNPCRSPAVRGKERCRIHGGSRGSGAKQGNINALKHGDYTIVARKFRLEVKQTLKENKKLIEQLI